MSLKLTTQQIVQLPEEHRKSVAGLLHCLSDGSYEDVMGHLSDLFDQSFIRVNEGLVDQGDDKIFTRQGALNHYFMWKDGQ